MKKNFKWIVLAISILFLIVAFAILLVMNFKVKFPGLINVLNLRLSFQYLVLVSVMTPGTLIFGAFVILTEDDKKRKILARGHAIFAFIISFPVFIMGLLCIISYPRGEGNYIKFVEPIVKEVNSLVQSTNNRYAVFIVLTIIGIIISVLPFLTLKGVENPKPKKK